MMLSSELANSLKPGVRIPGQDAVRLLNSIDQFLERVTLESCPITLARASAWQLGPGTRSFSIRHQGLSAAR